MRAPLHVRRPLLAASRVLGTLAAGWTAWRFWSLRQGYPRPGIFKSPEDRAQFLAAYNAALALWPEPYQEIDVPTRYGNSHVIVTGKKDAPPLILLHGAGTSSTMWYPNVADLRQQYRLYAVDTIGDGGKSVPSPPPISRQEYVRWLLDVLDALHIGTTRIAGLSYGGWLALNLALYAPERVARMVLLSPPAAFVPLGRIFTILTVFSSVFPLPPVFNRVVWPYLLARGHHPNPAFARQMMAVTRYCQLKLVPPTTFTDTELKRIQIPALLMVGEEESLYLWRQAVRRARNLMPNLEVEVIPGAAHALTMDQPKKVDQQMLAFLGQT